MSELKEHLFCECDECIREYRGPLSNEMRPYYLKSEADKVIEELKADYREACGRLQNANLIKDEQLAATRHQKFMRCNLLIDYCGLKQNTCEEEKVPFWRKWYFRWCELADKFKEAE